jgi:broad specificity phosphatase PhoE
MNPPLKIYFIRHGETEWSLSGRHTGHTDLPLTPHGEVMARGLAATLMGIKFSLVLTSPRLRARSTCALAGLAGKDNGDGDSDGHGAAQIEPKLAEWDYGKYEGLRSEEIHSRRPHWDLWKNGCPGGEKPADVARRAEQLVGRLCGLNGNIALFSHGHFGRVLAAMWIELPVKQGRHFVIDPASIGILSLDASHSQRRVISLWNSSGSLSR